MLAAAVPAVYEKLPPEQLSSNSATADASDAPSTSAMACFAHEKVLRRVCQELELLTALGGAHQWQLGSTATSRRPTEQSGVLAVRSTRERHQERVQRLVFAGLHDSLSSALQQARNSAQARRRRDERDVSQVCLVSGQRNGCKRRESAERTQSDEHGSILVGSEIHSRFAFCHAPHTSQHRERERGTKRVLYTAGTRPTANPFFHEREGHTVLVSLFHTRTLFSHTLRSAACVRDTLIINMAVCVCV